MLALRSALELNYNALFKGLLLQLIDPKNNCTVSETSMLLGPFG